MAAERNLLRVTGVCVILVLLLAETQVTRAARSKGCSSNFAPRGAMGGNLVPGRSTRHHFMHDGIQRDWVVHLPKKYMREHARDPSFRGHSLVLSIHGWCSNASQDETMTGLSRVADRENFIVVYPQGIGDRTGRPRRGCRSWNCVGTTQSPGPLGETCESWLESDYCYDSCTCKAAPGWYDFSSVVEVGGCAPYSYTKTAALTWTVHESFHTRNKCNFSSIHTYTHIQVESMQLDDVHKRYHSERHR